MKSSVFVRIDRYREVHDVISQVKSKVDEAQQVLKKVKELKTQEDDEISSWNDELESVERKVSEISEALTKQ
jgi:predicted  nucleic acid-binding Zn-ribbon protein